MTDTHNQKVEKIEMKGKIHKLKNSSSQLVIYKRTVPEDFEFKEEYVCVLVTKQGTVKFKTKKFKHNKLIRFKVPSTIAEVYVEQGMRVNITVIDDKIIVVEEGVSTDSISFLYPKYSIILYTNEEGGDE
ncbi:hypothetical protein TEU_03425 [Thermococcus eurythermalis]|uniref:Uncharacterized protein n=1 Tax=Thermococcus eurythermalis TaxID=1505907 RepID=A0A097QSN2_9EURY|nr:hypothetical protein [Thermococcus eurythermalis]AIU69472.1 hypothetical protein TEU_03425 [Thermococcus eurythermalis]